VLLRSAFLFFLHAVNYATVSDDSVKLLQRAFGRANAVMLDINALPLIIDTIFVVTK
jgi:hypothetical protein